MKKPLPEDFGITADWYASTSGGGHFPFEGYRTAIIIAAGLTPGVMGGIVYQSLFVAFVYGIPLGIVAFLATGLAFVPLLEWVVEGRSERCRGAKRYKEALAAYVRTLELYWMTLGGREFEQALAGLYAKSGWRVESTPVSGDKGIDLILKQDNHTVIVQCKSHKRPVGPATARELYGSLLDSRADSAILASTSGFTKGVRQFVADKPIQLVSTSDFIDMAERTSD